MERGGRKIKPDKIIEMYFSPTGTTKMIVSEISKGLEVQNIETVNLTKPNVRKTLRSNFEGNYIMIIGVPVYEERLPEVLKNLFYKLNGQGQPLIIVTLYGNIGDGIALKQLNHIVSQAGFLVVGAASFIGEHSFSNHEVKIAQGRPDVSDLDKARRFGEKIADKLNQLNSTLETPALQIEGKLPLMAKILPRNSAKKFAQKARVDLQKCNKCGVCVSACPLNAIDKQTLEIDDICLRCFACVKKCPLQARKINFTKKFIVKAFLKKKSAIRKEPIIYL